MRDFLIEQGVAKSDLVNGRLLDFHLRDALWKPESSYTGEGSIKLFWWYGCVGFARAAALPCPGLRGYGVGCHYRATSYSAAFLGFLPSPGGARDVQEAMHEWLGIGWYWLLGRI